MNKIIDIETFNAFINSNSLILVVAKTNNCGVCDVVLSKVEQLLEKYPNIKSSQIIIDEVPEFAGQYVVFTAPTILLFVDGKEILRESRFINFSELDNKIKRIDELY